MLHDVPPQEEQGDLSERFNDYVNFILDNLESIAPDALPNLQIVDEFDFLNSPTQVPPTSPISSSFLCFSGFIRNHNY